MDKVRREEILSLEDYKVVHQKFRVQNIKNKKHRRIHLGSFFTFLFENRDTVLYQIQEMIRVEGIQNEKAIQHEIDTYNQLLPPKYALCSTLLIEIEDLEYRKIKLKELLGIEEHIFLSINGRKNRATFDDEQLDQERISSVQFIHFLLGEQTSKEFLESDHVEISSTHPHYNYSSLLNKNQLEALRDDLRG